MILGCSAFKISLKRLSIRRPMMLPVLRGAWKRHLNPFFEVFRMALKISSKLVTVINIAE